MVIKILFVIKAWQLLIKNDTENSWLFSVVFNCKHISEKYFQ